MEMNFAKLTTSREADAALDRMLAACNHGFKGGRVTKTDLLSWLVLYFEKQSFQDSIESVRTHCFDQIAYLESLVKDMKKARKDGQSPSDLKPLLAPLTSKSSPIFQAAPTESRPTGSANTNFHGEKK